MKTLTDVLLSGLVCLTVLFSGCSESKTSTDTEIPANSSSDPKARTIINKAIEAHGGDRYKNHNVEFIFRNRNYQSIRSNGIYTYKRIFTDTSGRHVEDELSNDSVGRKIDGTPVELHDTLRSAYSSSVNSVIYFALLPYFLNDAAVNATYLGSTTIKSKSYNKVLVTFSQEGGGEEHEDEFIYWFNSDDHTLQYLAYNYLTDGGGARFREAYNPRTVNGIRFVDYINYKPNPETRYIMNFDTLFEAGNLEKLSVIELEKISVK